MTSRTLVLRSLRYHARSHLGVVLGAAVGSAALIGALIVGDSVRGSLREMALQRLGGIEYAMASADRFFRDDLRHDLERALPNPKNLFPSLTTALRLPGMAARQDGAARANRVQVLSLGPGLDHFIGQPALTNLGGDQVILNELLAQQLGARAGDSIVLRIYKPSVFSGEVALSPRNDSSVALRLSVHSVLPADLLGNFSLENSQLPPLNAFVRIDTLQKALGMEGRANLVLAGALCQFRPSEPLFLRAQNVVKDVLGKQPGSRFRELQEAVPTEYALDFFSDALRLGWAPQDAEIELSLLPDSGEVELRSSRIFVDPLVAQAALAQTNTFDASRLISAKPILTYLVNQFRAGERTTPYSMVTAAGSPWTPADLRDDQIVISQWLAEDLQLKPGDTVDLAYFLPSQARDCSSAPTAFKFTAWCRWRESTPTAR